MYQIRLCAPGQVTAIDVCYFAEEDANFALVEEAVSWNDAEGLERCDITRNRVMARCPDLLDFSEDDQLHSLHCTIKDFLEIKDVQSILAEEAGKDFDTHQFTCNASLMQMRYMFPKSRGEESYVDPFVLLGNFMYHAHQLELRGRLDYFLFPELDRTTALHRGGRYNMDCDWDQLGLKVGHNEAWLPARALKEGIQGHLTVTADSQVKILNERKLVSGRPPLDVALRSMESSRLGNETVKQLLDQGADPNERCEGRSTVWELHLLTHENSMTVPKEENLEFASTRRLLTSGVDPKLGRTFQRAVRAHFRPEEVEKQENPRLLDKQALKQSQKKSPRAPHGKAQEQGKKSQKISIFNIGKRLRGKQSSVYIKVFELAAQPTTCLPQVKGDSLYVLSPDTHESMLRATTPPQTRTPKGPAILPKSSFAFNMMHERAKEFSHDRSAFASH